MNVVNAATDSSSTFDQSAGVPGVINVLTAAATVPMDNYSVDTIALLKAKISEYNSGADMLRACKVVLQDQCPGQSLDPTELPGVDLFIIEVAFVFSDDPAQREKFKNIGTDCSLPADEIAALQQIGC